MEASGSLLWPHQLRDFDHVGNMRTWLDVNGRIDQLARLRRMEDFSVIGDRPRLGVAITRALAHRCQATDPVVRIHCSCPPKPSAGYTRTSLSGKDDPQSVNGLLRSLRRTSDLAGRSLRSRRTK